jgi:hypothetical protein
MLTDTPSRQVTLSSQHFWSNVIFVSEAPFGPFFFFFFFSFTLIHSMAYGVLVPPSFPFHRRSKKAAADPGGWQAYRESDMEGPRT